MNKLRRVPSLEEGKIQATILLKSLRSSDSDKAAKRFQLLPEFTGFSIGEIQQLHIKRKHALSVIAIENGFKSWLDFKIQIHFIVGGYLNSWFANYVDAKAHLQTAGGFLLPYKNQYFICNAPYMQQIGFDPADPDWKQIGNDWAVPSDQAAWQRLYKKWIKVRGGKNE